MESDRFGRVMLKVLTLAQSSNVRAFQTVLSCKLPRRLFSLIESATLQRFRYFRLSGPCRYQTGSNYLDQNTEVPHQTTELVVVNRSLI